MKLNVLHTAKNLILNNSRLKQFAMDALRFKNKLIYKKYLLKTYKPDVSNLQLETLKKYNENRILGYQQYICNAPFTSIYFRTNGDVLMCCYNHDDILGNVGKNSIQDILHSPVRTTVQQKIAQYHLHKGCDSCKKQIQQHNFNGAHAGVYDENRKISKTFLPQEMTFEISNKCNLECVMCSGKFSSLIRKNRDKLPPVPDNYPVDFLQQLKPFLTELKIVRFQGGEPFLIDTYLEIIEYLITANTDCKIYIQTNGSINNNRVRNIIQYRNVHLSISIDSLVPENYEEIRKNSSFKKVIQNIEDFKFNAGVYKKKININFCLMKNNWQELFQMIDFCIFHNFSLNIITVDFPIYYSIAEMPVKELSILLHTYKEKMEESQYKSYYSKLQNIINWAEEILNTKSELEARNEKTYQNMNPEMLFLLLKESVSEKYNSNYAQFYLEITGSMLNKVPSHLKKNLIIEFIFDTFLSSNNGANADMAMDLNIDFKQSVMNNINYRINKYQSHTL